MHTYYKQLSVLIGYTIFYHGLYYCPKINNTFNKCISIIHGFKIQSD